jgi:hypothetical protein
MPRLITLEEALELNRTVAEQSDLMTAEEKYRREEYLAELEAENGWLKHAESLGWEEDYLESLIESGLRLP